MSKSEQVPQNHLFIVGDTSSIMSRARNISYKARALLGKKGSSVEDAQRPLMMEYCSVLEVLQEVIGPDRLAIIGKNLTVPHFSEIYTSWPRDAFTLIDDGVIMPNKSAWSWDLRRIWFDEPDLGAGGTILARQKKILFGGCFVDSTRRSAVKLGQAGFQVSPMPFVKYSNYPYAEYHIDGHASLVEAANGRLHLLVASSYFNQDKATSFEIEKASGALDMDLDVLEDKNLPPLAFNIVQLADNSIVMTAGAPQLEEVLADLVGPTRVFTTSMVLTNIPRELEGSIRCMTNILPISMLQTPPKDCFL